MSVSIQVVEFERREAHLSELEEGPPFTVHGVALGADDVTVGQSGIKKLWPGEELRAAADTLEGTNLVEDHENGSRGVIGEVTKAGYKDGIGVIYEAELDDEDLAKKIESGRLEVSIRGHHKDVDEMEEHEETGAKIVENIRFENLSIVPTGAAPSNSIEMGEADELSVAELAAFTDELQEDEEFEPEAGEYVQWGDKQGIVLSMPEDGEVEVDIYEQEDDTYRPIGETEMVSTGDLSEWDVDEEDIGAMEDDEDEEEDESEEEAARRVPEEYFFEAKEDAESFVEEEDDLTGVHEMEDGWVPGDTHDEFLEWYDNQTTQGKHDKEEMAGAVDRGDYVRWKDADQSWKFGQVLSFEQSGNTMEARMRLFTEDGDKLDETKEKSIHGLEPWDGHPQTDEPRDDGKEATKDTSVDSVDPADIIKILGSVLSADEENLSKQEVGGRVETFLANEPTDDSVGAFCEWMSGDSTDEGDTESDVEELQSYEVHSPEYSGTTTSEWSSPDLENFDTDDLSEIDTHFIISSSGFPPENYGDLKLPVVEPNGDLNINALSAVKGGRGVSAVDGLGSDKEDEIITMVNNLAAEEFDKEWDEEEASANRTEGEEEPIENDADKEEVREQSPERFPDGKTAEESGSSERQPSDDEESFGPVSVLTGDDLQQRDKSGESEMDSHINVINMTNEIEEKLAELDEPAAVEKSELEELQEKANQFEEMNSSLEDLRERTEILDEVDREQVEELAEGEEPVVVESTRYDSLQDEAEQVKQVYAATLAETVEVFDAEELTDRFSIEELREKYEENIGDPEEELTANPRSGDPDEEELEEAAEESGDDGDSEEEEQIAELQSDLKSKITEGR